MSGSDYFANSDRRSSFPLIGGAGLAAILFLLCFIVCCYKCSLCPLYNKSNRRKRKAMSPATTVTHSCPNCQRRNSFTTIDTLSTQHRCQCRDCDTMSASVHCPILTGSYSPTPQPTPSDPYLQGLMDGSNWRNDTLRAHSLIESPCHQNHVPLTSQTTPTTPAPTLAALPQNTSTSTVSSPAYRPTSLGMLPPTPVSAPTLPRGHRLYVPEAKYPEQTDECASVSDAGKTSSSRDSWTGSESTVLCMTTFRPLGGIGPLLPLQQRTPATTPGGLPTIIDVEASRRDSGVLIEEDSPYDSSNNSGSNSGVTTAQGWAAKVAESGGRARLAAAAIGAIGAGILPRKAYDRDT